MRDARWNRFGGVAGILFVLVAVAAAALTGSPPKPEVSDTVFKDFFIDKQDLLVTQGWMYALCAPLLLWFAVAVRRILHEADEVGYLGDLFLAGTTAVAALLVVAMAMQIAIAKAADSLGAETVRAVGVDFGVVVVGLWGFIVAVTGFAYAACVMAYGVLPGRVHQLWAVLHGGRLHRLGPNARDHSLVPRDLDRDSADARPNWDNR
jgi:hypothetical protein